MAITHSLIPWWAWALIATASVTVIEYFNRTAGFATPLHAFRVTGVFILICQSALMYSWRDAPTMMAAWTVFSLSTNLIRVGSVTWLVGEVPSLTTLTGVALIIGGSFLVKAGS